VNDEVDAGDCRRICQPPEIGGRDRPAVIVSPRRLTPPNPVHLPVSGDERPHALLRLVAVTAQCSFAGVLRRIGKHAG
jgi:hypothetical protein